VGILPVPVVYSTSVAWDVLGWSDGAKTTTLELMNVHDIMTAHARCVSPDNTLVEAAGLMRELDVGSLPVCEGDRLVGMITDRDMAIRAIAHGLDPNITVVADVMSPGVAHVSADQSVEQAARLMQERGIRRLPVLDRMQRLVGILSLGDMAVSSNPAFSGFTLREVSHPVRPNGRDRRREAMGRFAGGSIMPRVPEVATAKKAAGPKRRAAQTKRPAARLGANGRKPATVSVKATSKTTAKKKTKSASTKSRSR